MTGIGGVHNKFHTCKDCPDRAVEPNCHDTCRGYLYRQAQGLKINEERRKGFEYYDYRDDLMRKKTGEK